MSYLLEVECAAQSMRGRRREINQDVFAIASDVGIYVLADGLGGRGAGEVAAAMAVRCILDFYTAGGPWPEDAPDPRNDPCALVIAATKFANQCIRHISTLDPGFGRMAAAVTGVEINPSGFCLFHVGHVRAYRLREGGLDRLTRDHTVRNRSLDEGASPEVAARAPGADQLARALGFCARVDVTACVEEARPGDVVALVTNGIYDVVSDPQMALLLAGGGPLAATADRLITGAQAHDARGDVGCLLLRWRAADAAGSPDEQDRAASSGDSRQR